MVILQGAVSPSTLQQAGPVAPVLVHVPGGQGRVVDAQPDDGSTISSVDLSVLQAIGAPIIGQQTVETVTGTQTVNVYGAAILTPDGQEQILTASSGVLGVTIGGGVMALLGRDVMASLDFAYQGPQGTWQLTQPGVIPPAPVSPWWYAAAGAMALGGVGLLAVGVGREEYRRGRRDEREYEHGTRRRVA